MKLTMRMSFELELFYRRKKPFTAATIEKFRKHADIEPLERQIQSSVKKQLLILTLDLFANRKKKRNESYRCKLSELFTVSQERIAATFL